MIGSLIVTATSIARRNPLAKVPSGRGLFLLLAFVLPWSPLGAEDDRQSAKDSYQVVWTSVSDVVARREYGSALSILETASEEPDLRACGRQITADRNVITGLQTLQAFVVQEAAKLEEGAPIEISGADYSIIRYDRDPQKDELVLLSKALRKEIRKPISKLPTGTWIKLAQPRLASIDNSPLILGVFVGFDQASDAKLARKYFNEASTSGQDVKVWLTRLSDLETTRKAEGMAAAKRGGDDPIVGKWSMRAPNGLLFNTHLKADGTVAVTIPPGTLVELRKRKMPLPPPGNLKGNWTRDDNGLYRVTWGPITIEALLIGDRLRGRGPAGKVGHGIRMVD
jgi:hypothetical protein